MVAPENVLTNISEMIDLAIGTPEVGVVDFGMLQTVLHCLAQQLRVLGKNVELRGSIAALPVGRQTDIAQTVAVTEFIIDTGSPGKYELATYPLEPEHESVLVVERKRRNDPQVIVMTASTRSGDHGKAAKPAKSEPTTSAPAAPAPTVSAPTVPSPTVPAPTVSAPTVPAPTVPAPTVPAPTVPAPTVHAPTVHAPTVPASTVPSPTASAPTAPTSTVPSPTASAPTAPTYAAPTPVPPSQHPSRVPTSSPPARASVERLSLVTLSKFNLLENTVADLKERVYGTTPKNEEILQEVRSQSNLKAITDMWTNMNVASRLDAAEEGIKKLSSLIEDLIGESAEMQKKFDTQLLGQKKLSDALPALSKTSKASSGHGVRLAVSESSHPPQAQAVQPETFEFEPSPSMIELWRLRDTEQFATKGELMQVVSHLQSLRDDLDNLTKAFSDAMKDVHPTFVAPPPQPPSRIELAAPPPPPTPSMPTPLVSQQRQAPAPAPAPAPAQLITVITPPTIPISKTNEVQPAHLTQLESRLLEKLNQLEHDLRKCCDNVRKAEGNFRDQFTSFQDQLEDMTKHMVSTGPAGLSPDLVKDLQGLMQLFETVQTMQTQLQQVHETALNLAAEKEDRQNHIDALLEQIELLKVIKLDREDMVEALADKADLRMLARKVSHDQFENACDDLSKGLEHALGKLNVQESLWQQALDDIQREIEQKLDKMELSPVKDFFNSKLKQLQENLKAMAALRREAEAAGTKRRLLRDVNCISCDAKAVMAMEAPPPQPAKPLPANLSMKPYLSYELDAIRKNQASSLPQRNMHDWEHVQQQMQPTNKPHKVRSDTDKHLCNRYCGGSHTVTTPAQRVARLGHFIKQWGPEVLPLSSGFAAGDDGRLYKISTSEGAGVGPGGASEGAPVCTPKSPAKKPSPPSGPKPIVITAECRCLDPTADHSAPH